MNSNWSYSPETPIFGQTLFWPLWPWPWPLTMTFCTAITFVKVITHDYFMMVRWQEHCEKEILWKFVLSCDEASYTAYLRLLSCFPSLYRVVHVRRWVFISIVYGTSLWTLWHLNCVSPWLRRKYSMKYYTAEFIKDSVWSLHKNATNEIFS